MARRVQCVAGVMIRAAVASPPEHPLSSLRLKSVFVAGPFIGVIDPETGRMRERDQHLIESLVEHFADGGAEVYNAHRRELWGVKLMQPLEYTRLDYEGVAACDVFVVQPGAPASLGTHVELGWASALGKPIVLLLDPEATYAGMVLGLASLVPTAAVPLKNHTVDFGELDAAVVDVVLRKRAGIGGAR